MHRVAPLLIVALSIGCSRQKIDTSIAGVFDLHSRDGSLLPAPMPTVFDGRECVNEMLSAAMTIKPNGEWSESMIVQHRCVGPGAEIIGPKASEYFGKFKLIGDNPQRLELTSDELEDEGNGQVAVIDGNELRLTFTVGGAMKSHLFVYRRRA
jgi:hypothetical protein